MNASWLSAIIGADAANVAGYLITTLLVFLGIWACFMFFRRSKGHSFRKSGRRDNHRISVRDIVTIDSRRRLVLIRRDNIEHLLLTGGDSDLVVETFTDLPAGKEHSPEIRSNAEMQKNARLADIKTGSAAAHPAEKNRNAAENTYMARPQPVPPAGNNAGGAKGGAGAERQRDLAAEAALAGRMARDMPPNREARSYRPDSAPHYPPQAAAPNPAARAEDRANPAYRDAPRPNNRQEAARQEMAMWNETAERGRQQPRDMRSNNPALLNEQTLRQGNMEAFSAPPAHEMQPEHRPRYPRAGRGLSP